MAHSWLFIFTSKRHSKELREINRKLTRTLAYTSPLLPRGDATGLEHGGMRALGRIR